MSTNTFLTTKTTTTSSLAATAYGNSSFFFFVQDQIKGAHPLYDLHRSRPSSIFLDMLGSRDIFVDYIDTQDFKIFAKLRALFPQKSINLSNLFLDLFLRELDNLTEYSIAPEKFLEENINIFIEEISLGEYVQSSEESREFAQLFMAELSKQTTNISRLKEILLIILENPMTKLDDAPADLLLPLRKGLSTDYNHKGLTKERVEIPISDWQNDYIYRDLKVYDASRSRLLVVENYDGYGIDFLRNFTLTNGITTENIYLEDRLDEIELPKMNPTRLKAGEARIINFDLINAPTGIVEV